MSQKNLVLKKLAALALSASICTTIVGATPPEKQKSSSNILTYAGYAIAAAVVTGTTAYLAWAQLFVNKVLAAAENLANELNNATLDTQKVEQLSMEFYTLLQEATEQAGKPEAKTFGTAGCEAYKNAEQCKTQALALIKEKLKSGEVGEDEQTAPTKRKIKVNRLRSVDRETLKKELTNTFQPTRQQNRSTDQNQNQPAKSAPNDPALPQMQQQQPIQTIQTNQTIQPMEGQPTLQMQTPAHETQMNQSQPIQPAAHEHNTPGSQAKVTTKDGKKSTSSSSSSSTSETSSEESKSHAEKSEYRQEPKPMKEAASQTETTVPKIESTANVTSPTTDD